MDFNRIFDKKYNLKFRFKSLIPFYLPVFRGENDGGSSGVTNKDIIGVSVTGFFIQSSPDAFEDLP